MNVQRFIKAGRAVTAAGVAAMLAPMIEPESSSARGPNAPVVVSRRAR